MNVTNQAKAGRYGQAEGAYAPGAARAGGIAVCRMAMAWILWGVLCGSLSFGTEPTGVKFATFNVSLYGESAGQVRQKLRSGDWDRAAKIAAIVQRVRPDVLLVNEVDIDPGGETAKALNAWFAEPQDVGREHTTGEFTGIHYPYVYAAASNTGFDSMTDLDGDGRRGGPNDCWGFGRYPGQYGFALYSRYPIQRDGVRTFQKFLWSDLRDADRPRYPDGRPFHSDAVWNRLRLSSKNHVDIPLRIGSRLVHVLASHPTPPVFDGKADRNGCRNHDEIRFWQRYLSGSAGEIRDDAGVAGGLGREALFVLMGDLNSDPEAGESKRSAIRNLIGHERTQAFSPRSRGASEDRNGRDDETADFGSNGQMRVDFVIPSVDLKATGSGVFWPAATEPGAELISASDHRLVWVEVVKP